jgi:hypothetical protein
MLSDAGSGAWALRGALGVGGARDGLEFEGPTLGTEGGPDPGARLVRPAVDGSQALVSLARALVAATHAVVPAGVGAADPCPDLTRLRAAGDSAGCDRRSRRWLRGRGIRRRCDGGGARGHGSEHARAGSTERSGTSCRHWVPTPRRGFRLRVRVWVWPRVPSSWVSRNKAISQRTGGAPRRPAPVFAHRSACRGAGETERYVAW